MTEARILLATQQMRYMDPMLVECWVSVVDDQPTLKQAIVKQSLFVQLIIRNKIYKKTASTAIFLSQNKHMRVFFTNLKLWVAVARRGVWKNV